MPYLEENQAGVIQDPLKFLIGAITTIETIEAPQILELEASMIMTILYLIVEANIHTAKIVRVSGDGYMIKLPRVMPL